jgi:uncharacterized protein (TIGR02270 family)
MPDKEKKNCEPQPLAKGEVIEQCVEDAPSLWRQHSAAIEQPHFKLKHLQYLDRRLEAQLQALRTFGSGAWAACDREYLLDDIAHVFTMTVFALLTDDAERLRRLYAACQSLPTAQRGITAGFGWISGQYLRGVVRQLLASSSAVARRIGIAACAIHRTEPGPALIEGLEDADPALRARSLRAVGELGKIDLRSICARATGAEDDGVAFWAAWSAVLLGDEATAFDALRRLSLAPGPFQDRALCVTLQALPLAAAAGVLRELNHARADVRIVLKSSGLVGSPSYITWLIEYMRRPDTARAAGEAFSMITGVDIAYLDLDRSAPEEVESGPNDDPSDDKVAPDPDENLPWPDPARIEKWWSANFHRFQPDARYFMGEPLNAANCARVLREGYQRQRIGAALYLALLNPGTPLFEWRAPAWRQQRMLARIS